MNENIHKIKAQEIRWSNDKYMLTAPHKILQNILSEQDFDFLRHYEAVKTEYLILTFLRFWNIEILCLLHIN